MMQTVSAALARKLSVGREEQEEKPRSILRALRLAFARAASDRLQLPLAVIGAKQSSRSTDALTDGIGEDWLLLRFVDRNGKAASVCMELGVVAAIVQVQTFGEMLADDPAPRVFTHTDGAMVAPLIEDVFSRAVELVDASADQSILTGYEFAARFSDLRTLTLAMVEDVYRAFELTIELGGGLRQGRVSILLPERPDEENDPDLPEDNGPKLEQASGVLRAELNTVICRMSLPLATLSDLVVGDVLPLTGSRLDHAEVLTIDRTRTAIGRLGQCSGMRAVRLNEYVNVASLSQSENEEFSDSPSSMVPHNEPEIPMQTEVAQVPALFDPPVMKDIEPDLNFAESDELLVDPAQFAELATSETEPGSHS
ncbi:FliM/FliN family flagellar motor C-terminal domain-containing protein [Ruegeria profundi]|uniref:FliM/FliN family flagellar motor C-terminal domain-containing protein n=1 Tax=Ruegeria profundi TaxID=1685378 RepID=UPI001CD6BABA|nr:flagellar motor switch protein FliM [Ruegeria profundi]MCA0927658.1 FliM/FliN family flagellar motor switch protein [Ruegeria profundi]